MREGSPLIWAVLVVAAAAGGFVWWRAQKPVPVAPIAASRPPVAGRSGAVAAAPPIADAGPRHPLAAGESSTGQEAAPADTGPDAADAYFDRALARLLGSKAVRSFIKIDQFARRLTATVANLPTENAAVDLWPVERTPGSFQVAATGDRTTIDARNSTRYDPFVALVEKADARAVVALYRRAYPILQRAYEELGYPGRYFNDQVVETIDHLLATPDISGAIEVKRVTTANGSGTLYQFEDPSLENRSAGQKLLLRLGRAHAVRLKAKLLEVRALISSGTTPR